MDKSTETKSWKWNKLRSKNLSSKLHRKSHICATSRQNRSLSTIQAHTGGEGDFAFGAVLDVFANVTALLETIKTDWNGIVHSREAFYGRL